MTIYTAENVHEILSPEAQKARAKEFLAKHRLNQKVTTIALQACGISKGSTIHDLSLEQVEEYVRMRAIVRESLLKYESEVKA